MSDVNNAFNTDRLYCANNRSISLLTLDRQGQESLAFLNITFRITNQLLEGWQQATSEWIMATMDKQNYVQQNPLNLQIMTANLHKNSIVSPLNVCCKYDNLANKKHRLVKITSTKQRTNKR